MKPPAFQLYAADFYMDTAHWEPEEVGVYFRLLMFEWVNKAIPNDIKQMARISGLSPKKFAKTFKIISPKFVQKDDKKLINLKMEAIREKQDNYRESQAIAGKKGAKKRWNSDSNPNGDPISNPNGEKMALQSSSSVTTPKSPKGDNSYSPLFLNFWSKYPSKVGKGAAWKAWKKLKSPSTIMDKIIKAIDEQSRTEKWRKNNGQYIPNPATWINQCRWEDETNIEPEIKYESVE